MSTKITARMKAYAAEQKKRGMVDAGTNRYSVLEDRTCKALGDDYSPGDIAQAARIEGATVEEARTIISNLGFGGGRSESALKAQYGKAYTVPEIVGT